MNFTKDELTNHIKDRYVVLEDTGCWEWNRARDRNGYARLVIRVDKQPVLYNGLHRYMYKAFNGIIPKNKPIIRHMCNNPSCINPEHLQCGTQKDNIHDAMEAGTHIAVRPSVKRNFLTAEDKATIYEALRSGQSAYSLAKEYNCSLTNMLYYKNKLEAMLKEAKENEVTEVLQ